MREEQCSVRGMRGCDTRGRVVVVYEGVWLRCFNVCKRVVVVLPCMNECGCGI